MPGIIHGFLKKKAFQLSHLKNYKNKNIETIYIKKDSPFYKIINLHKIILSAYRYLNNGRKNILVIEGASWVFYSFFTLIFLKYSYHLQK